MGLGVEIGAIEKQRESPLAGKSELAILGRTDRPGGVEVAPAAGKAANRTGIEAVGSQHRPARTFPAQDHHLLAAEAAGEARQRGRPESRLLHGNQQVTDDIEKLVRRRQGGSRNHAQASLAASAPVRTARQTEAGARSRG